MHAGGSAPHKAAEGRCGAQGAGTRATGTATLLSAVAVVALAGCGGSNVDVKRIEREVGKEVSSEMVIVGDLHSFDCVKRDDRQARCVAELVNGFDETTRMSIEVTVGDDGKLLWEQR
jgi:hypothetical protein